LELVGLFDVFGEVGCGGVDCGYEGLVVG